MKLGDSKRPFRMTPAVALSSAVVVLLLWGVPGPAGGCGGPVDDDPAAFDAASPDGGSGGYEQSAYVITEVPEEQDAGSDGGMSECEEVLLLPAPPL